MEYADEPRLHFSQLSVHDYCEFYRLEMDDYLSDLPFYQTMIQPSDRVLELGCGTGRITRQLAPFCQRITGIDSSPTMLDMARKIKPATHLQGVNIVYEQQDMLDFSFPSCFDVIIIPYNTLNLLSESTRVETSLTLCRKHLSPKGRLGVQLYHPDAKLLATFHSQKLFQFKIMADGFGGKVIKESLKSYDLKSSTLHVEERYRVRPCREEKPNRDLSHTYTLFAPLLPVWLELFSTCGFTIDQCSGTPDGDPFKQESDTSLFLGASPN